MTKRGHQRIQRVVAKSVAIAPSLVANLVAQLATPCPNLGHKFGHGLLNLVTHLDTGRPKFGHAFGHSWSNFGHTFCRKIWSQMAKFWSRNLVTDRNKNFSSLA